jgi:arylformamidase
MTSFIDLTLPIAAGMPFNPDHFPPEISTYATVEDRGWEARRLTLDSHLGTHMDAPAHFIAGGMSIDRIPLEVLAGPAQVLRLAGLGPRQSITPDLLPPINETRVLLHTGWAEEMLGREEYFTQYPYLTPEAAHVLADAGVRLVGFDTPSPDYDPGDTHIVLLGRGAVIVENVMHLDRVPDRCWIAALPLPIAGGDGCPSRVIAAPIESGG